MCGILGTIQEQARLSADEFGRMLDTLAHRGPDGRNVVARCGGRALLGHRRLAIIDLTQAGTQPIANEDESIWLTFNGEIYNYRPLRAELEHLGHRFRSQSDSEVIVHAYEEWGTECVRRFRGIFAFGIWNEREETLFIARDPLGVKPLYYAQYDNRFSFASQPKAIAADPTFRRGIAPQAFSSFLAYGYVPHDQAIFSGMAKLPAGHTAILARGALRISSYWQISDGLPFRDAAQAEKAIEEGLVDAVNSQLVSDVPVGCFLSGGIDSSLLVGVAHEQHPDLRTFTIGFHELESDERAYAKQIARHFQTVHFESVVERPRLEERLWSLQEYFDEPFDPNGPIPFFEVARLARQNNTVVALGGDGADEMFAGYLRYDDFDRPPLATSGTLAAVHRRLRRLGIIGARATGTNDIARYFAYEGCLPLADQRRLLTDAFAGQIREDESVLMRRFFKNGLPAVAAAQRLDMALYLVDHILCKVDRAAMAHGVEARVPFLDPGLVALAFRLPLEINYRRGERKALLKQLAHRFLPEQVITTRKKGFSSPIGVWCDDDFRIWANGILKDGVLIGLGVLRADWQQRLESLPGRAGTWNRAWWLVLTGELWARRWLAGPEMSPFARIAIR